MLNAGGDVRRIHDANLSESVGVRELESGPFDPSTVELHLTERIGP